MADHDRYVDSIKVLNERVLGQLDDEKAKIDERRAEAQRVIAKCAIDDIAVGEKRKALLQAQAMQLAYLDGLPSAKQVAAKMPPPPPPSLPHPPSAESMPDQAQRRARIGPQRYFMLTALRANGSLAIAEIMKETSLPERRIRDQLRSDIADGVIDEVLVGVAHKYKLSKAGGELLMRFEEYRRTSGKGLPTPEDARQQSADIFS